MLGALSCALGISAQLPASVYIQSDDVQSKHHLLGLRSSVEHGASSSLKHSGHKLEHRRANQIPIFTQDYIKQSADQDDTNCIVDSSHRIIYPQLQACLSKRASSGALNDWSKSFFRFERSAKSDSAQTYLELGAGNAIDMANPKRESASAYLASVSSRQWQRFALQIGARQLSSNERDRKRFIYDSYLLYQVPFQTELRFKGRAHDEKPDLAPATKQKPALSIELKEPLIGLGNHNTHQSLNLLSSGYDIYSDPYSANTFAQVSLPILRHNDQERKTLAEIGLHLGARQRLRDLPRRNDSLSDELKTQTLSASIDTELGLHLGYYKEAGLGNDTNPIALGLAREQYQLSYQTTISVLAKPSQLQLFGVTTNLANTPSRYESAGFNIGWVGGSEALVLHRLGIEYRTLRSAERFDADEAISLQGYPLNYSSLGLERDIALGGYHEFESGSFFTWSVHERDGSNNGGFLQIAEGSDTNQTSYGVKTSYTHNFSNAIRLEWSAAYFDTKQSYLRTLEGDTPLASVAEIDQTQISVRLLLRLR